MSLASTTITGTVAVTGALTDTQLRAAGVPVLGTFWQATQPVSFTWQGLTDTQIRAAPLPVTGPLTDAQLRASALALPTGASTEATLAALSAKTPVLGAAAATASQPVVLAQHLTIVGPAAQTVVANNILASDSATSSDSSAYQSGVLEIVSTGTAGGWIAEQSINGTSWTPVLLYETSVLSGAPINAAVVPTAATRSFVFQNPAPLFRVRIATAVTGGNLQARTTLSQVPFAHPILSMVQATAAALNATNTPVTPTPIFLSSLATTNATSVKASAGTLWSFVATNTNVAARYLKLYNKASSPVVGTDVPALTIQIPAGGVPAQLDGGSNGLRFPLGIAFAFTVMAADTDATAVAANEIKVVGNFT